MTYPVFTITYQYWIWELQKPCFSVFSDR